MRWAKIVDNSTRMIQPFVAALALGTGIWSTSSYAAPSAFLALPLSRYEGSCLPPERIPTTIQADLVRLMGRTDSLSNKILFSRGVARVPTTQIHIVSDTTTCRRAADAYSAAIHVPSGNRTVYAVRAGIRYVVIDPSYKVGEWKLAITFDSSFTEVKAKFGY